MLTLVRTSHMPLTAKWKNLKPGIQGLCRWTLNLCEKKILKQLSLSRFSLIVPAIMPGEESSAKDDIPQSLRQRQFKAVRYREGKSHCRDDQYNDESNVEVGNEPTDSVEDEEEGAELDEATKSRHASKRGAKTKRRVLNADNVTVDG